MDIKSLATSGRHLSKLEKTAENAASDGFVSNFNGGRLVAVFRPHQLVGVLLICYCTALCIIPSMDDGVIFY